VPLDARVVETRDRNSAVTQRLLSAVPSKTYKV
jgi:hypothetical protein